MNQFGTLFRLTIFGESHGRGVGIVVDGCPSGIALRTRRGAIFAGGYLESAAYNPSLPPLQAALIAAVTGGGVAWGDIAEVVLVELEEEHAPVQQADSARLVVAKIAPQAAFRVLHAARRGQVISFD